MFKGIIERTIADLLREKVKQAERAWEQIANDLGIKHTEQLAKLSDEHAAEIDQSLKDHVKTIFQGLFS